VEDAGDTLHTQRALDSAYLFDVRVNYKKRRGSALSEFSWRAATLQQHWIRSSGHGSGFTGVSTTKATTKLLGGISQWRPHGPWTGDKILSH
jgi:hypothetical protein